jgi:AcrR family transcriptional regulator
MALEVIRTVAPLVGCLPRTVYDVKATTLALLWRDPSAVPRRGPRRALSLDTLVARAIELADEEGLAAVTIRRTAQRLGVGAMSLYTYVGDRDELLELMMDAVYAEMGRPDTTGRPWRERLTAVAEENWALYRRHPWAARVATLRPPLGPGQMAKYEHELAAFDDCGLDDVTADDCLTQLLILVRACARDAGDARAIRAASGADDEQWWATAGPMLARVMDAERYPRAVRIGSAAGAAHGSAHDPAHAFQFGLGRLLDGLARLIPEG